MTEQISLIIQINQKKYSIELYSRIANPFLPLVKYKFQSGKQFFNKIFSNNKLLPKENLFKIINYHHSPHLLHNTFRTIRLDLLVWSSGGANALKLIKV